MYCYLLHPLDPVHVTSFWYPRKSGHTLQVAAHLRAEIIRLFILCGSGSVILYHRWLLNTVALHGRDHLKCIAVIQNCPNRPNEQNSSIEIVGI